jgi:CspA family cold shock protein
MLFWLTSLRCPCYCGDKFAVIQGSRKGNSMALGKVKWFNNAKGFGFIVPEDGGEDIFAHYSTIKMDGYRSLKAGQDVTYEVQQGPKGLHAENIGLNDEEPDR